MPIEADFRIDRGNDQTLVIELKPPVPIGGENIRFTLADRFGSVSPRLVKSMSSGFYGVSGLNIVNSGQGILNVALWAVDTSGMPFGNYAFELRRWDSGSVTDLTQGYLILRPSMG